MGIGVGFAPRVIDGLALVAACLAVATARMAPVEGPAPIRLALRFAPVVLAAVVAIVTLDSILGVGDRFGALLGSDPASVVAYLVYIASAVPLVSAAALVLRPLVLRGPGAPAAPAAPAAELRTVLGGGYGASNLSVWTIADSSSRTFSGVSGPDAASTTTVCPLRSRIQRRST